MVAFESLTRLDLQLRRVRVCDHRQRRGHMLVEQPGQLADKVGWQHKQRAANGGTGAG